MNRFRLESLCLSLERGIDPLGHCDHILGLGHLGIHQVEELHSEIWDRHMGTVKYTISLHGGRPIE